MTIKPFFKNISYWLMNYFRNLVGHFELKESITGVAKCDTTYLPIAIFDLNNINVQECSKKIELRSFEFGDSHDDTNPSIATFAIEDCIAYNNSPFFIKDMRGNLKHQRHKPKIIISEPALILPYYTTHFGHFTGDCLGAIIAFSNEKRLSGHKLFYIAPNSFDNLLNRYGNPDVLHKIDSKQAFENNLIFSKAALLPRLSSWQNLSLCSQIFGSVNPQLPPNCHSHKKVFLTSGRTSRIQNLNELIEYLETKDFYICRPDQITFEQCLRIVRDADTVISENGSITHNLLIARNKPFYILTSGHWKKLSPEEFAGGGIYNAYKSYLANYIECNTTDSISHHTFSDQIIVNLVDIKNLI